jgi:hypothetical protein
MLNVIKTLFYISILVDKCHIYILHWRVLHRLGKKDVRNKRMNLTIWSHLQQFLWPKVFS